MDCRCSKLVHQLEVIPQPNWVEGRSITVLLSNSVSKSIHITPSAGKLKFIVIGPLETCSLMNQVDNR